MSFKTNILKKYLEDKEIYQVIWHNTVVYIPTIIKYLFLLGLLYFFSRFIENNIQGVYVPLLIGIIWMFIYIKFVIDFLDLYLDSVVLTHTDIVIFRWDWFLKYRTEAIQRDSVEAINNEQSWILDLIFNKWDIKIKRQEWSYFFRDVTNPSKIANDIVVLKNQLETWEYNESDTENDIDKFDILVETLWEVIIDYVKKEK
jgi:hypothetical protein